MEIKIIKEPISRKEAKKIGEEFYVDMVKGVADIKEGVIALGGEYHIDANNVLVEEGSLQEDIWGFNIFPERPENWIEYTSLINIRPTANNRGMEVEDEEIRQKMKEIIEKLII